MMCRVSEDGDLLDSNGEELVSINELVDDVSDISTLNEKAKLITIQGYPGMEFFLYITTRQRSYWKVMFSIMFVCPLAGGGPPIQGYDILSTGPFFPPC